MAIDLSALLGGGSASGTMSPLAMYRKLQKLAVENADKNAEDPALTQAKEVTRQFNNAAVRLRNAQYREQNAQVQNDALYYKNRAATATTVSELINDDRFLKVLATANGFTDLYLSDRQKLRDILTSDLSDPGSVARTGTLQQLELARKYSFGATGTQLDVNGATVGINAAGQLVNDGTEVTPLPAGLAKLRGLSIDTNGAALVVTSSSVPAEIGTLIRGTYLSVPDAAKYTSSQSKALLKEEEAPTPPKVPTYYEFEGPEFETFRQRKDVQAEINYYKDNIGSVKTIDDFFANTRLLKFVLKSYDLESEVQFPGKIRKILESDLTDVDSLANRFQDPRYKKLTEDLSFFVFQTSKLTLGSTTLDMVKRFERVEFERSLDQQAPGVRAAIEFGRRIKDVTQTVQLLGDSVLREVVLVANNIPQQIAYQEVGSQVTALEKRVNVADLKSDQNEIEKMVMRYLTFKDGASTGGTQSYLLNLFG